MRIGFPEDFRRRFLALRAAAIRAAQAIRGTSAVLSLRAQKACSSLPMTASLSSASNFKTLATVTTSLKPTKSCSLRRMISKAKTIPKSQNSKGSSSRNSSRAATLAAALGSIEDDCNSASFLDSARQGPIMTGGIEKVSST